MKKHPRSGKKPDRYFFYGTHAVKAALENKDRPCYTLFTTSSHADLKNEILRLAERRQLEPQAVDTAKLQSLVGFDKTHQNVVLEVGELQTPSLTEVLKNNAQKDQTFLLLDQLTDPMNVGAILRSAKAFGVQAVLMPKHGSCALNAVVAKTAAGALDKMAIVQVTNVYQAL